MPILNLILLLVLIGVILWLVNTYIPMAAPIKTVLNVVIVIAVVIWILNILGFGNLEIGRPAVR